MSDITPGDVRYVRTLAELRQVPPDDTIRTAVTVGGSVTVGDGGGGLWYWDATDQSTPDDGISVLIGTISHFGRWKLAGLPTRPGTNNPIATPSWIRLPNNWFSGAWFNAKKQALAGTGQANLAIIGDSISNGVDPNNTLGYLANGYPDRLRTLLMNAGLPIWADYYPFWSYTQSPGGAQNNANEGFPNGASLNVDGGILGVSFATGANGVWNQTITTGNIPGWTAGLVTGFDLVYYDFAVGTWSFDIDGGQGGSPTVVGATWNAGTGRYDVTCAGGGLGAGTMKKVTVSGLAAGSHVIRYGQQSTTNVLKIHGISLYNGNTAGLGFVRSAYSGYKAADVAAKNATTVQAGTQSSYPFDKLLLWAGQGGTNAPQSPTPFGFPVQPHLAIIAWGVNDCIVGINVDQFEVALARHVKALRRGTPNCNVAFLATCHPDGVYSDNAFTGTGFWWDLYKARMLKVADMYQCAYVDIDAKWQGNPVAAGFMQSNNVHPLSAGYADMAAVLSSII